MTHRLFSTTIALACLGAVAGVPMMALAESNASQIVAQQAGPQIDQFSVESVSRLAPGTELVFILQGTPNARATLTIGNTVRNLPMREIEPGVYEGRYTLRQQDRFSANTIVRANLQRNNRVASVRLQEPLISDSVNPAGTNAETSTDNSISTNPINSNLRINQFTMQPVQQAEPGTELVFNLIGTPNATATFSIDGVAYNQPMREIASGNYEGRYVIRRQDYFPANGATVTAALQANNQVVRSRLAQSLFANNTLNSTSGSTLSTTQLPLEILSPQNNSRVNGTVEVRGRSAPNTTVAVNVKAETSLAGIIGLDRNILDRTVQTDAQGNFSFTFSPTITVPGTRYQVSLNATRGTETGRGTLVLIQQ